jgi:hypothetical protein
MVVMDARLRRGRKPFVNDDILLLETAPSSDASEFVVVDTAGAAEAITNMTSDPHSAGAKDIIIADG